MMMSLPNSALPELRSLPLIPLAAVAQQPLDQHVTVSLPAKKTENLGQIFQVGTMGERSSGQEAVGCFPVISK